MRNAACVVCGDRPSITELIDYEQFCRSSAHDRPEVPSLYLFILIIIKLCKSKKKKFVQDRKIDILDEERHITCETYDRLVREGVPHLLLDVRSDEEFAICSLPNSLRTHLPPPSDTPPTNGGSADIPLRRLSEQVDVVVSQAAQSPGTAPLSSKLLLLWLWGRILIWGGGLSLFCGLPVYVLCRRGNDSQRAVSLLNERGFVGARNIKGGLLEWARRIDPRFPIY
jgi:adenylyltransferase/sulfurtransferase